MSAPKTLAAFFVDVNKRVKGSQQYILKRLAEDTLEEARAMFGTYDNGGDWPALAASTLRHHKAKQSSIQAAGFSGFDTPLVVTGELMNSIGMTVGPGYSAVGTDNPLMEIHELGDEHTPARPVFGPVKGKIEAKIDRIMQLALEQVMEK